MLKSAISKTFRLKIIIQNLKSSSEICVLLTFSGLTVGIYVTRYPVPLYPFGPLYSFGPHLTTFSLSRTGAPPLLGVYIGRGFSPEQDNYLKSKIIT